MPLSAKPSGITCSLSSPLVGFVWTSADLRHTSLTIKTILKPSFRVQGSLLGFYRYISNPWGGVWCRGNILPSTPVNQKVIQIHYPVYIEEEKKTLQPSSHQTSPEQNDTEPVSSKLPILSSRCQEKGRWSQVGLPYHLQRSSQSLSWTDHTFSHQVRNSYSLPCTRWSTLTECIRCPLITWYYCPSSLHIPEKQVFVVPC